MESELRKVQDLYCDDKILQAARAIEILEKKVADILSHASATLGQREEAQNIRTKLNLKPFLKIRNQCAEVLALRASLHSKEGWIPSYDGKDTKVWYRREDDTASHSILIEGQIHAPLVNVTALIYESDLYDKLFWYVSSSCTLELEEPSRLRKAAYMSVYSPWPLYNRDVAVLAFAVDALDEDDCVMVVSRSLKDSDGLKGQIPSASSGKKVVRVDMHNSGFEFNPASPGVTKARFLYNVDPHLAFVPMALINWGARTFCRYSLRLLESRAQNMDKLPEQYREKLNTEPVYEYIRTRLTEYWTSKGHTQETIQNAETKAANSLIRNDSFDPDKLPKGPSTAVVKSLLRGRDEGSSSKKRSTVS